MDISKLKSGDKVKGLKCPHCKKIDGIKVHGTYGKEEESHELECDCFFTQRVNPKEFTLTYESKEEKEEREEIEKAEKEEKKNSKGRRR